MQNTPSLCWRTREDTGVHGRPEPAPDYGADAQETCVPRVRGKWRNGTTPGGEGETHAYTHAHTCTRGPSDGCPAPSGSQAAGGQPHLLAWLRTSAAAVLTPYTSFSPFKAQTYLQFQIHLSNSENHNKQVHRGLAHRSWGSFVAGCIAKDGSRPEAARRCEPSPCAAVARGQVHPPPSSRRGHGRGRSGKSTTGSGVFTISYLQ